MVLYTMPDCIYCTVLKARLKHEGAEYEEVTNPDIIREKGFETLPRLEADGRTMDFYESILWLNDKGGRNL